MNPLIEVLCNEITKIKKALTTTGSDYTATVTKVEGDTAYVQIAGSDISDTPVALSVNADVGDHVRVRVANGKAWITGNDSSPPTDDTKAEQAIQETRAINERINNTEEAADGRYSKIEQTVDQITLEVGVAESKADTAQTTANGRMKADMSNKASSITIGSGQIAFNSNTLVVNSSQFTLDVSGNAKFSGNLSAATGTFKGKVAFSFTGPNTYSQDIYINDTTKNSGIYLKRTGSSYGTLETFIDAGYIELAQSSPDRSYSISSQSSDRRQKENIEKIDAELALQLKPVQFQFKGDEAICYGFIAQDVEDVIPNAVSTNERTGYLMLNYHEFIAPTLALAQHNNNLIKSLTKQIENLEARLKALEDKK